MSPNLQSQAVNGIPATGGILISVLRFLFCWMVLSCLTLPFMGRVWLGELPVLAVIQLPKILVAGWLREHVVMEAMTRFGLSQGSFSPDYILARPYALALAYMIPMAILGVIILRRLPFREERLRWLAVASLGMGVLDYAFTLTFADGRSLTIY